MRRLVHGKDGSVGSAARDVQAEQAVGRVLRLANRASRGSHLLHAVPSHRGDIDHVVIGATGIFAIETVGYGGTVRLADDRFICSGSPCEPDPLAQARRAATAVRELLAAENIAPESVQAVVCLPNASIVRPQCCRGVLVARPGQLDFLIRHWRGRVLGDAAVARAFAVLRAQSQRRVAA